MGGHGFGGAGPLRRGAAPRASWAARANAPAGSAGAGRGGLGAVVPPRSSSGSFADVRGDPPGLVTGEQLSRRASARLVLEIEIAERLSAGVADDEALGNLLDTSTAVGSGAVRACQIEFGLTSAKWTFPAGAAVVIGERTTPGGS